MERGLPSPSPRRLRFKDSAPHPPKPIVRRWVENPRSVLQSPFHLSINNHDIRSRGCRNHNDLPGDRSVGRVCGHIFRRSDRGSRGCGGIPSYDRRDRPRSRPRQLLEPHLAARPMSAGVRRDHTLWCSWSKRLHTPPSLPIFSILLSSRGETPVFQKKFTPKSKYHFFSPTPPPPPANPTGLRPRSMDWRRDRHK